MTQPNSPPTPSPPSETSIELEFVPPNRVPSVLIARGVAPKPSPGTFGMLINSSGTPIAVSFATWCDNNWTASFINVTLPDLYRVRVQSEDWTVEHSIALPTACPDAATTGAAMLDTPIEVSIDTITCDPPGVAPTKVTATGQVGHPYSTVAVMILLASTEALVAAAPVARGSLLPTWKASFNNIMANSYLLKVVDEFGSSDVEPFSVPCSG